MSTLLDDPFGHHLWANERLLEACLALTPDQLSAPVPGTYGSIIDTLRHLVSSDAWYLSLIASPGLDADPQQAVDPRELLRAVSTLAGDWRALLAADPDPDREIVDIEDGREYRYPASILLAQALHHGTDHRSQVCTALTNLGIDPPDIDVWAYGEAIGRAG